MSKLRTNEIEPFSSTGVAIGGPPTSNPSAILDVQSTSQGMLTPRMTTVQRDAIVAPVEGLLVYNLNDGRLEQYTSGQWTVVGNGLSPVKNVLRVVKNPVLNSGDFSSINAALASITTNSPTNQYAIEIGPGVFTETQITLKPYVAIIGESALTTTIVPNDPTADLIIGSDFARIERVTIKGVTAPGKAAIHSTSNVQLFISKCQFASNAIGINVSATNLLTIGNVLVEECFFAGMYGMAVSATSVGGAISNVILREFTVSAQLATASQFFITGTGTTCVLDDLQLAGNNGIIGIEFQDGAIVRIDSGNLSGCNTGIVSNNVGTAPNILMTGTAFISNTNDIAINHPSTAGTVNGVADETKCSFDPGTISTLAIAIYDPIGNLVTSRNHVVRQPDNTFTDITTLATSSAPIGIYVNGDISPPVSGFTVTVEAGLGYLQKLDGSLRKIIWPNTPVAVSPSFTTWLYFDSTGTLNSSGIFPDPVQNIVLGRVVSDATKILIIEESGFQATHMANSIGTALRFGLGPVYDVGSLVAEFGTRQLTITAGNYYFGELNFRLQGGNPITFTSFYQDGSGGFVSVYNQDTIDNVNWDNGTGTLTPIGTGNYAKHAIYALGDSTNDFDSEAYFLVYSQAQYTALVLAEQGSLPNPPNYLLGEATTLIASIIVQQGTANIVEIRDERPLFSSRRVSSIAATTFHHNLLGLNDFDDHLRYLPVDGSRPMTGDLPMGTHNVTNAGTYNGVVVENHHARHQPGSGLDELLTATAVTLNTDQANAIGVSTSLSRADHIHNVPTAVATGLNANSTNAQGAATTFSRSDHTHAIASGTPSAQIPDQANATGTSTNFARADHIHNILTAAAVSQTPNNANADGSAASFSRSDHVHNIPTTAPANQTIAAAASDGSSATFSRSDHLHTFSTAAPQTLNPDVSNTIGTSTSFARADHIHNVPTAIAVDIGTANAQGSSTNFSRADHVHRGVRSVKAGLAGTQRFGDISIDPGSGTSVTDDGSGNLTVDTTGGPNELAVTNGGGLVANYTAGKVRYDGIFTQIAAGSITLTANITNGRLYVDVDGVVKQTASNTVAPPYTTALALFTTGSSTITLLVDHRTFLNQNIVRGLVTDISTVLPDATAIAGSTDRLADAGHTHAIVTAAASTQTPDQSNAKGVSSSFARADHIHDIPTAVASTISSNADAQGTAASFARSDHTHQITQGTASQDHVPQYDGSNWQATYPEAVLNLGRAWSISEDWLNAGSTGTLNWTATLVGGASTATVSATGSDSNHPGVVVLTAGNAAARFASLSLGTSNMFLGGGTLVIECLFNLQTLTNTAFRLGLGDQTAADHTNGVYLEYNSGVSANWLIKTANGGTRTSTTTTVPATANAWHKLVITVNAAASSVSYTLDGTSLGSIATNIPTANAVSPNLMSDSLSNANSAMWIDYYKLYQRFTTPR